MKESLQLIDHLFTLGINPDDFFCIKVEDKRVTYIGKCNTKVLRLLQDLNCKMEYDSARMWLCAKENINGVIVDFTLSL